MKHYCVHCGAELSSDPGGICASCPECGKATPLPPLTVEPNGDNEPSAPASRGVRRKDILIGTVVLLVLAILVFFLLRTNSPVRQLVFGDLEPAPNQHQDNSSSQRPSEPSSAHPPSGNGTPSTTGGSAQSSGGGFASGASPSGRGNPSSPVATPNGQVGDDQPSTITTAPIANAQPAAPGSAPSSPASGAGGNQTTVPGQEANGLAQPSVNPPGNAPRRGAPGTPTSAAIATDGGQRDNSNLALAQPNAPTASPSTITGTPATGTPATGTPPAQQANNTGSPAQPPSNTGATPAPANNTAPLNNASPPSPGNQVASRAEAAPTSATQRSTETPVATSPPSVPATSPSATPSTSTRSTDSPASQPNNTATTSPAPTTPATQQAQAPTPTSPTATTQPPPAQTPPATLPTTPTTTPNPLRPGRTKNTPAAPLEEPAPPPEELVKEKIEDLLQLQKKEATPDKPADQPAANATPPDKPEPPAATTPDDKTRGSGESKPKEENPATKAPFDPQRGSNIVFLVDHSNSMSGEKSKVARRELVKTLEALGPDKSFYVLFFHSFGAGYKAMPAPGLLPATPENIHAMTNFIYTTGHNWWSDPTKALNKAIELKPDTIWLLSDGEFDLKISQTIRKANEPLGARIHTVGFYNRKGEQVLRQIAQENGGTYRFVSPPE